MIKAFVNRPDRDPNIGIVERVAYGMGDFSLIFSWAILLRKPRALMARPVSGSGAC